MGLFGSKKKSDPMGSGIAGGMPDLKFGMNTPQTQQPYDPMMMDNNSGLKLADLNSPEENPGGGLDSFGNPRPQQKVESFEYRQQPNSAPIVDTSKDLQIIIAKLDAIRSEITNINHRLDNIERTQKEAPPKKYPW